MPSVAARNFFYAAFTLGWLGLCVWLGTVKAWRDIPALDDLLWRNEWIGTVGLVAIYFVGRRLVLDLLGWRET